jgi:putative ABC transport system permease protein
MDWTALVRARLPEITGDGARDGEIVEELAQHLAQRFEEARAGGATGEEALERALAELRGHGDLARALRHADRRRPRAPLPPPTPRRGGLLADLAQDLRYALRLLAREPAFTATAVLTLALGIGATAAVFSVVDAVLVRPIPFTEPDRLVLVWETDRDSGTTREPASLPDFLDFQARSRTLSTVAGLRGLEASLTPPRGEPTRLAALAVTHELLPMLGVRPRAGRGFGAGDDLPGAPERVMISECLRVRLFGSDAEALGSTLVVDEHPRTIVGVVPPTADFGIQQILAAAAYSRGFADRSVRVDVDVWLPLVRDPEALPRSTHPMILVGRLADGVRLAAAQEELAGIAADLDRAYSVNDARGTFLEPLSDVVLGPVRPALLVLLGAVALVLLIACANVASLLLARGTTRAREIAVRTALGAGTARLARQFAVENTVLALASGATGILLAFGGLRLLLALAPGDVPRLASAGIDARVLAVALLVSVGSGLVFGTLPVVQGRRLDLRRSLGADDGRSATTSRERSTLRSFLVAAEVALAVMLVAGAGLLIKSFWRLLQVDPGFRVEGVFKAEYQLPASRYPRDFQTWPDFVEMHRFHRELLAAAAALPGVRSAAIAGNHPLDPGFTNSFSVVGREAESRSWPEISVRRVTPGYFETLGVPLLEGRRLAERDGTHARPVVVINAAAARRFFADRDPLGQQIVFWGAKRTVVGVVGNERFQGVAAVPPPAVYAPLAHAPTVSGPESLLVRGEGRSSGLLSAMRGAIRSVDPALAVFGAQPLADTLSQSLRERRFVMLVLASFAVLAVLLAAVGVHGLLSYSVARRRREIGIRVALGAEPGRVTALVVGQGVRLVLAGLAVGAVGALALTRLLGGLLFGVTAADPGTFLAVLLVMGGVGLLASYLPARRAVRLDPLVALRPD